MPKEITEIAVAISQPLKVEADQILDYLKVHIGDVVTKQTVLAAKKGMFGLGGIELKSPVEGIVHNIDLESGVLVINLGASRPLVPGLVKTEPDPMLEDIKPIKTEKKLTTTKFKRTASSNYETIEGLFGCGLAKGTGWFIEYGFNARSILPEMEGRIILINTMPSMSEVYKASAIGIAGIVVATKDIDAQFLHILKQDLQGKSHLGFLVLPEGVSLATLHGVLLEIEGEEKRMLVEKK